MYDLELEKAVEKIKKEKAKRVVIQLPDGIKNKGKLIVDHLRKETKAEIIIWSGSCFGSCDTPLEAKRLGTDLLIQWGHSPWKY
jgi:2-(3-amino-3-carboxypropyl)histidine synthase